MSDHNDSFIRTMPESKFAYGNYIAQTYLWPYWPTLFLILGTVTNSMSIAVFTRRDMRKHSSFVYFAFMNVVNLIALYVNCFRGLLHYNFAIDIRSQSLFVCKFHVFLTYFLCHLSSLILSTISIDRVISVMFLPLSKKLCTPIVAMKVSAGLFIFNFILSSHFLTLESAYLSNSTVICEPHSETLYNFFVQNIWKVIDMVLYAFIPFAIMLTCSVIIIFKISGQSKKLDHSMDKNKFNARTRNLALMLIPVNLMFLFFVGPVVVAIYTYTNLGRDQLALVTVEILSTCNFTLNFFVYFATSSKFREEFYKLFHETFNTNPTRSYINETKKFSISSRKKSLPNANNKLEKVSLTCDRDKTHLQRASIN